MENKGEIERRREEGNLGRTVVALGGEEDDMWRGADAG